jgi:hypothetical protein
LEKNIYWEKNFGGEKLISVTAQKLSKIKSYKIFINIFLKLYNIDL